MKLHEFVKKTLVENHAIFSTQAFRDGLVRYRARYEKNKQDVTQWIIAREGQPDDWPEKNPLPAPLLLGNTHTDPDDARAISAAMLAALHDKFLEDTFSPVTPADWPVNVREFLQKSVLQRFKNKESEDISAGWGLDFANRVKAAIILIKTSREQHEKILESNATGAADTIKIELAVLGKRNGEYIRILKNMDKAAAGTRIKTPNSKSAVRTLKASFPEHKKLFHQNKESVYCDKMVILTSELK